MTIAWCRGQQKPSFHWLNNMGLSFLRDPPPPKKKGKDVGCSWFSVSKATKKGGTRKKTDLYPFCWLNNMGLVFCLGDPLMSLLSLEQSKRMLKARLYLALLEICCSLLQDIEANGGIGVSFRAIYVFGSAKHDAEPEDMTHICVLQAWAKMWVRPLLVGKLVNEKDAKRTASVLTGVANCEAPCLTASLKQIKRAGASGLHLALQTAPLVPEASDLWFPEAGDLWVFTPGLAGKPALRGVMLMPKHACKILGS